MDQRFPRQASFNGSGLILTYLVVLAIEAWPISLLNRQASIPPLACMVPVVCRRQCGCTGQVIFAFCPAVRDHLVDGKPREGLAALAGEDVRSPGLLLALQSLEANGLVAFEVMGAVDRALEAPDGDGALAPVDVIPAQVDQLADPEAVQERHQRDHVVAVAVAVALQRRKQPVEFVLGQRLTLAAIGLGS